MIWIVAHVLDFAHLDGCLLISFFFFGADMCLKKCKDDEMLFETIQTFKIGELLQ